ncbi:recombinase family protein [Clostridium sp. Cult1]|uniref:recombinase family protein n=1 Tax=Clostridium sp. Cult1 TaxID=2079002 RepID=UPI001F0048BE|nr:recombinase family protein [Clostridium sp. Cult1]MCF6464163.1 recombinase family protein [Clostridium sp. Cult1]
MKIAIYSRKSKFTGKGDSIENQIEMCKDYAFKHFECSEEDIIIYEDEGFSGGNINRPKFLKMMQDAKDKKFDVLICYRLDRVSRDVADFSNTIEELNDHNIAFVSIKEQFDTSTPMGRAMMYIASVFSQLERETIAERIKDNMLELAKTGRWLGGIPSLGFETKKITYLDEEFKERSLTVLEPVKEEMKTVEFFYDKYLELGSIHKLRKYLIQNDFKTRNRSYYSSRALSDILRNPAYVKANEKVVEYLESKGIEVAGQDRLNNKKGILVYNKTNKNGIQNNIDEWIAAVAKHEGSISPEKWLEVQYKLDKNSIKIPREGTSSVALLSGILKCKYCGSAMNVMYGRKRKDGTAPHYYVCNLKTISAKDKCDNNNVNGMDIEYTVINKILALAENKDMLLEELEALKKNDNTSTNANLLSELKNKKEKLLEEIDNLVGEVSKSAVASKYILPQIESKDKEVKDLEEQISKLEDKAEKINKDAENFNLVVNNIINFAEIANTLDNKQKKYFIQTIVENVYWDGEKELVGIKIFTRNIEVSKFCTTSSRTSY